MTASFLNSGQSDCLTFVQISMHWIVYSCLVINRDLTFLLHLGLFERYKRFSYRDAMIEARKLQFILCLVLPIVLLQTTFGAGE